MLPNSSATENVQWRDYVRCIKTHTTTITYCERRFAVHLQRIHIPTRSARRCGGDGRTSALRTHHQSADLLLRQTTSYIYIRRTCSFIADHDALMVYLNHGQTRFAFALSCNLKKKFEMVTRSIQSVVTCQNDKCNTSVRLLRHLRAQKRPNR